MRRSLFQAARCFDILTNLRAVNKTEYLDNFLFFFDRS